MALYMIQVSYSQQAIAAMVKNPQDRSVAVRAAIERAGGKMHGFWFCFGDADVVVIAEVADNVSAAALAMAVGAAGTASSYRTTPLLTAAEALEAMKKAGAASYQPPR